MSEDTENDAKEASENAKEPSDSERIAKRLARAGVCSRRDAEKLIAEGRVKVNGKKLDTPAFLVGPTDAVLVDGVLVAEPEKSRVWRYNKPPGLVTSHRDEKGRPTVFDKLPSTMPRVISVGRLDLTSEGLLLLTNDGALARSLELPAAGWVRRYRVRVHGEVDPEVLLKLENGVTVDGVQYGPIKALLERQKGSNAWVTVSLKEGKNREIRKVMEHMGWPVSRLIRVAYGPFQLGNLAEGEVEEVPGKVIKEQLGIGGGGWAKAEIDDKPHLPHKGHRQQSERKDAPRPHSERMDAPRPQPDRKDAQRFQQPERKDAQRPQADRKDAQRPQTDRKDAQRPQADRKDAQRPQTDRKDSSRGLQADRKDEARKPMARKENSNADRRRKS